jgi:DNA processing protein
LRDDPEASAVLFARGDARSLDAPTVAIVGTRRCTTSGAGIAYELGRDLTNSGVCIVSGLALGIDGAAHRGALAATGPAPIAVVGSGLDVIYPRQNAALWHDVERAGAVLSEAPLGARPERWRFPDRNRIIAGLADVVVVVESRHAGGSMHTVDEADKRGIDVMAVPGSIRSAAAGGTNDLLAEGRAPVRDADDVLMAIGLTTRVEPGGRDDRPPATDVAAVVLDAFEWQPVTGDHLTLRTGLPVPTVALALAQLEADGWVVASGGWYERVASTR